MDKNRIAAWACGIIAALLVIMAGKSCAPDTKKPSKLASGEKYEDEASADMSDSEIYQSQTGNVQLDMFGRPIDPTEAESELVTDEDDNIIEPETENITEHPIQYVTDVFGNVIGTEPTPTEAETITEAIEEETTLSFLDQYNEDQKKPPPDISGHNHGQYDEDGNLKPTIPPDFVIII